MAISRRFATARLNSGNRFRQKAAGELIYSPSPKRFLKARNPGDVRIFANTGFTARFSGCHSRASADRPSHFTVLGSSPILYHCLKAFTGSTCSARSVGAEAAIRATTAVAMAASASPIGSAGLTL